MVTKKLLILSHGQATDERGFSINSHMAVQNLKEESLVAQRIVHDAITTAGGVCQMPVTKSMLSYAQGAQQRYMAYLAEKEKVLKKNIEQNFNSKRNMTNVEMYVVRFQSAVCSIKFLTLNGLEVFFP